MGGRHWQTTRQRGYDSQWEKAREAFIAHNPHCLGCKAIGIETRADAVDHVIPHGGVQSLFWDPTNWQPVCHWHHNSIKAKLENDWLAGKIKREALRLDSPEAIKLTRQLRRVPIGRDGWPMQ
jgi:5-methylcytosine-specific restriction protein A